MKVLIVVVVALLGVGAHAKVIGPFQEIINGHNYHELIGIPAAERIRLEEEQMLSDPSRIVGGSQSSLGQHPHHAGVLVSIPGGLSLCGGSMLSNTRTLTAAHCWSSGTVTVVLGSITLFSGGVRTDTNNVQRHANYNPNSSNYDIAMIIHGSVGYTNNIRAVPWATGTSNTFVGQNAVATGFGSTGGPIVQGQQKHHVTLPVISNDECRQTYGGFIGDTIICTSGAGGRGTCGGDSGGPLTLVINGVRTQIGVVSFGAAVGCDAGLPAGYVRVTHFADWIAARM